MQAPAPETLTPAVPSGTLVAYVEWVRVSIRLPTEMAREGPAPAPAPARRQGLCTHGPSNTREAWRVRESKQKA